MTSFSLTFCFVEYTYLIKKIIGSDFHLASLCIINWMTVIIFHTFLLFLQMNNWVWFAIGICIIFAYYFEPLS